MLQLKTEQLQALQVEQKKRSALPKAKEIRERFADFFPFYTDQQLELWVLRQFDYLESVQIDSQAALDQIMDMFALYGEKFERCDSNAWALDILSNPHHDADAKAFLLKNDVAKHESSGLFFVP